ncbi:very-long-chain (3R)-3-hydroxyacyl-CoA dehydratase 1 isoform X2 [Hemicordylus capensis]|uniref:very-long-chain (3R)-3-hydroxyacyl-CoA dehydratase 1 isoform X2 n=1 Tax=Hemicordylus capensis TaxID=884348 RepID=UPI002304333F|nr:very-long-chain (3R)-3-hydroxyacyl-CoA dehydratase 1 isoform X2 [Hemicordylus capensis]
MWAAAWEQLPSGSAKTDGASARVSRSSCQPRLRLTPPPSRPARVGLRLSALGLGPGRTTMASSEEDGASNGSMEEKNSKKAPRRHRAVTTAWLIFYNITMTAGWLVLAIAMARFYMDKGTHKGLYKSIQKTLKFFQTFALLEIVHCAVVHTSVLVTGVQVSSRIFMVWFITHSIKQIQNEDSVVLFLVVWTVTEITRYSFYTFNMLNHLPYFIKWARYNFFIILYPVGVVGELLTIYAALPYAKRSGMFSVRLPNKYNVSFDYYYFLIIVMASYIPLFPQLYFHMLRQRRRVLHGEVIVEKDD